MATEEVRRLGLTLAAGSERLRSAGLVHCDVKPSNLLFHEGRPKLADYDLVAAGHEGDRPLGTEGFFPPDETASAIGRYRVTLDDGSVHEHPLVFGGNLADWSQVRGRSRPPMHPW